MACDNPRVGEMDSITAAARAVASLAPAVCGLEEGAVELDDVRRAAQRGWFTPAEDERLRAWFARYLTARAGLLETIGGLAPLATGAREDAGDQARLRSFVVAYTAACLLVRAGRYLVSTVGASPVVQRKLNEAEPRFRMPRKQYTRVRRSLTSPLNAWRLRQATRFADANRPEMERLAADADLAVVLAHLRAAEPAIRVGAGEYVRARLRFRLHSFRWRRSSLAEQATFAIFAVFGSAIADLRPRRTPRVNERVLRDLSSLLAPGDVIITRRDYAASNLFLPGYWPHASLHLGPPSVRHEMGIAVSDGVAQRWTGPVRVLEARKDGVLLRALDDTLSVDAVAVIRPRLAPADLARALSAALRHEGKLYNFDFDFFRADRLVCTQLVHRAFDGIGGLQFDLVRRAGRLTLSAEDLLDMALRYRGFEPVAVFGAAGCRRRLVTGSAAREALAASYGAATAAPRGGSTEGAP